MSFSFYYNVDTVGAVTKYSLKSLLLYVAILLSMFLIHMEMDSLYAQRSIPYVKVRSSLIKNSLQGYPGLFDTNTVREGSFIFEIPYLTYNNVNINLFKNNNNEEDENTIEEKKTVKDNGFGFTLLLPVMNIEYGINSSLSLGINPAPYMSMLLGGIGGSLKVRTKVYEGDSFSDVVTFSAGGLSIDISEDIPISLNYFLFSNNISFALSSNSSFTLSSHFWSFSAYTSLTGVKGDEDIENYGNLDFLTTFLAGNYHYSFGQHLGVSAVVLWPFYIDCTVDTLETKASIDSFGTNYKNTFFRLGADWNIGHHLIEGGVAYTNSLIGVHSNSVIFWLGYSLDYSFFN